MLAVSVDKPNSVLIQRLDTESIFSVPQKERLNVSINSSELNLDVVKVDAELNTERMESTVRTAMRVSVPAITKMVSVDAGVHANVITIWEGEVTATDGKTMCVKLRDRQGLLPEHTADVELEWVAPQDQELVRPGAVFYWTLYREVKRGAISGSQEIRFRRLPNWTKNQISNIYQDADKMLAKFATSNRYAD